MEFYSIGVYNSTEQEYFDKLTENSIDTFCDIRQRRGIRGATYSFVNSKRLQSKLQELCINYMHIIDLAPTTEIRDLQKVADICQKELKRERSKLGDVFTLNYKRLILDKFDFKQFIADLERLGAKKIVLFCVEEQPSACHRSLVTDKLIEYGYKITHL